MDSQRADLADGRTLYVGDRVELIVMPNDPCPVEPGSTGTVVSITVFDPPLPSSHSIWVDGKAITTQIPCDPMTHQVGVEWDERRSLNLCLPADEFKIISQAEHPSTRK